MLLSDAEANAMNDYEANQAGYVATEGSIRENETVKE